MLPSKMLLTSLIAVAIAALGGCATEQESQPAAPQQPVDAAAGAEQAEVSEALAALSPADRKLVEEQEICPVSGEPLGSMGTPIKVTVDGRQLFICCEGCEEAAKERFDEYYAALQQPRSDAELK